VRSTLSLPRQPLQASRPTLSLCRRQAKYDWWRSDWNPMDWDAENWFATHDQAPWVEHTLSLIEEGWDNLHAPAVPLQPERYFQPPPAVLTVWEIYCRQQVDKRRAWEAEQSRLLWAEVGKNERLHHDTHYRDIRLQERFADVPNYRPGREWTEQEIKELIACPPAALDALQISDPRWKSNYRGMRPMDLDESEYLESLGRVRPSGSTNPRLASEITVSDMLAGRMPAAGFANVGKGVPGSGGGYELPDAFSEATGPSEDLAQRSSEDLQTAVDVGGDDDF